MRVCLFSRLKHPAIASILTAMLLSCIFAAFGLYPFGSKTLSWGDMSQQVVPLLMEFKDILEGRAGMFLNLQNAGGMSFWGVFFFFLSSPFSFLVLLVEKSAIFQLVNVLVILKLSLTSGVAAWFFGQETPNLPAAANAALAISYGLCGYGLLYYQNLVWLDMLCLFPLVMAGYSRLMKSGRNLLLTVSLALAVVLNYYLSFMLFLSLVIFGAVTIHLCVPKMDRGKVAGKLGISAISALLLTAVVWIPSVLQCLSSARTDGVLDGIRTGSFWAETTTTLPVLLCSAGAASPLLCDLFPRSKRSKALMICWMLTVLPMLLEPVNKLWHFGSYQAFPARYGYIPVFLGMWFLADRLGAAQSMPVKRVRLLPIILLLPIVTGTYLLGFRFQEISSYTTTLWVSSVAFRLCAVFWGGCIIALALIVAAYMKGLRQMGAWLLLALSLIQGAVQSAGFIGSAANAASTSLAVISTESPDDSGLYRVKPASKFFNVNLLGAAGYPTMDHYTSLTDRRFFAAMKKLGYSSYWMENSGCCGTVIGDIILSNKYALAESFTWDPTGSGDLGYLVPAGALPESLELGDRLALQNQLTESLIGTKMFQHYQPTEGEVSFDGGSITLEHGTIRWDIQVGERSYLYFDAFDCISNSLREKINDGFTIYVNGQELAASYPNQRCNGILELGQFEDETVIIEAKAHKQMSLCSFGVWGMELSRAGDLANCLPNAQLSFQNGKLIGTAQAEPGQALFLSVPWYSGMDVRVNSQPVRSRIVLDCFMEIPLEPGENTITISYIPNGIIPGAAISLATLLIVLATAIFKERIPDKLIQLWYRLAKWLLRTAFWAVILVVYLLPVCLWAIR